MANIQKDIQQLLNQLRDIVDQSADNIRLLIDIINIMPPTSSRESERYIIYIIGMVEAIIDNKDGSDGLQELKLLMLNILNRALKVLDIIDDHKMIDYLIINTQARNASEYLQYCRKSVLGAIKCLNSVNFISFHISAQDAHRKHFCIKQAFTYAMIKVPMLFENIELASERHKQHRKELLTFAVSVHNACIRRDTKTIEKFLAAAIVNISCSNEDICCKSYWLRHISSFISNKTPNNDGISS